MSPAPAPPPPSSTTPLPSSTGVPIPPPPSPTSTLPVIPCDIGVWGPSGSGKTAFLAAAMTTINVNLSYDVKAPRDLQENNFLRRETEVFLSRVQAPMAAGENFADTAVQQLDPMLLYVGYPDNGSGGRKGRFHRLYVYDAAGEHIFQESNEHRYWQHLRETKGILMVLNGEPKTKSGIRGKSYEYLIQNMVTRLGYTSQGSIGGKLPHYLAICLTHADQIIGQIKHLQPPEKYDANTHLQAIIGKTSYQKLYNEFIEKRVKVFFSSPLGWYFKDKQWQPNATLLNEKDFKFVLADPQQWRSYNTAHPILWLFDQIEHDRLGQRTPLLRWYTRGQRRFTNLDIMDAELCSILKNNPIYQNYVP